MAHKERVCLMGALLGAAAGATIAYLYATEEGTQRRWQLARAIDRFSIDAEEAQRLWLRLNEAWAQFEQDRLRPAAARPRSWPPGGAA